MSPVQKYSLPFSQGSFGGGLACTSIACLTACAYADGASLSLVELEKYTRVGAKLWRMHGQSRLQSAAYVMSFYEFFKNTYKIESYQVYTCTEHEGRISLHEFFQQFETETQFLKHDVGIVFTDGCGSYAVGRSGGLWHAFDSHGPQASVYRFVDMESVVNSIAALFISSDSLVDATTILSLPESS